MNIIAKLRSGAATLLAAAMLCGCASLPPPSAPLVSHLACTAGLSDVFGTETRVGSLRLTALHVVEACSGTGLEAAPGSYHDLALGGAPVPPEDCRDASVGERVTFSGYPATTRAGRAYTAKSPPILERDAGVVTSAAIETAAFLSAHPEGTGKTLKGLSSATMTRVRAGYSGGAVSSAEDGRLVGIINAADTNYGIVYFTPVSAICNSINETL